MGALETFLGAGGLGAGASIATGQIGESHSQNDSVSDSWGSSGSQAYNQADSWGWSNAFGDSWGQSDGGSSSQSKNVSNTFGSEASARDFEYAQEANKVQRALWNDQADYNAKQAQIDRDFQERMANTAYQRAVLDLKAAGLNPILAVQSMGAATPVGAMASSGMASAYKGNSFADQSAYGSSSSSAWERSRSGSHNESHSKNGSHSEGGSSSWSSEGSHSESHGNSDSSWEPAYVKGMETVGKVAQDAVNKVGEMVTGAGNTAKKGYQDRVSKNGGKVSSGNIGMSHSKWVDQKAHDALTGKSKKHSNSTHK